MSSGPHLFLLIDRVGVGWGGLNKSYSQYFYRLLVQLYRPPIKESVSVNYRQMHIMNQQLSGSGNPTFALFCTVAYVQYG